MNWTAVIPLKGRAERKTRLARRLSAQERHRLSEAMFAHVVDILRACPDVAEVAVLSDVVPHGWNGLFFADAGRGLNDEVGLLADRLAPRPLLVIHADLPLLSVADVAILLAAAEGGVAIAPDRHGTGTNAIALREAGPFPFSFGPGSFARHLEAIGGIASVVERTGLAVDIDTPGDYDALALSDLNGGAVRSNRTGMNVLTAHSQRAGR